jgi:1-deoxyxylulose-5-phosphate synthase
VSLCEKRITMGHVNLGRTGLKISRLCLGCMSCGESERGNYPCMPGEAQSRSFLKKEVDLA